MNRHFVKNFLYPIHEKLKGKKTIRILKDLENSQKLPRSIVEDIQLDKLKKLVHHAYRTVPYYKKMFDRHGIRPEDIRTTEDYSKIPLLTKEMVRANSEKLMSAGYKGKRILYTTGGSTGKPLKFYVDNERIGNEWAANWRARRWWGVDIGDRMVSIWASPIEITTQNKIKDLRDRLLNNRIISALDIQPDSVLDYLKIIDRHKTDYLFGYASCIYFMAKVIHERRLSFSTKLKAIYTTADTLFDHQRELVEKAFHAPVGIEYGARDGGFIAHECPQGGLHVFEEGVLVEIIDQNGQVVPDGQEGEIVLTILDSPIMPFLRYRIGDVGQLSKDTCACGIKLKIMEKLVGRKCDNLLRQDGSIVHGPALANILITNPNIEHYQILQKSYDNIHLKLVTNTTLNDNELNLIRSGFEKIIGSSVNVEFERVESIKTAASGKTRYIISDILEETRT